MLKEILVIDDNPDIRFLICSILEEQNLKYGLQLIMIRLFLKLIIVYQI